MFLTIESGSGKLWLKSRKIPMHLFAKVVSLGTALFLAMPTANAAVVLRNYEYFALNGRTAADLDRELNSRGPMLKKTGQRHPGSTQMRFTNRIKYGSDGKSCRVVDANIVVHALVHLPRWKQRRTAPPDLAMIWDTLSADIKRHEESHIVIARTAAGNMERQIKALPWRSNCTTLKNDIDTLTAKLMRQHDLAQIQFDKVEGINFESRFERLLTYRLIREFGGQTP
jgi:predicted secreted Zn-dependent protease